MIRNSSTGKVRTRKSLEQQTSSVVVLKSFVEKFKYSTNKGDLIELNNISVLVVNKNEQSSHYTKRLCNEKMED